MVQNNAAVAQSEFAMKSLALPMYDQQYIFPVLAVEHCTHPLFPVIVNSCDTIEYISRHVGTSILLTLSVYKL